LAKKRTKQNIIDGIAVSYLSRLLKTEETIIDKITENENDILLVIEQASKKRLNKKSLLELHPKLSSLLMVFREGGKAGLPFDECIYLSEMLYEYFFCLNKIKKISFPTDKPTERGAKLCLVLIIFFSEAIENYCKPDPKMPDYEKTKEFYYKYIKAGFKNCKIDINLDNFKEVLTIIRDKYIKSK